MKYRFWSIAVLKSCDCYWPVNCPKCAGTSREWLWLCIPPNENYIPSWYQKGALIKKHEEELLPPPSYWFKPSYENLVYNNNF